MSDDNKSVNEAVTETAKQAPKSAWTSVQVYALSIVCLLVGVALGFLFRGSSMARSGGASPAAVSQAQMPNAPQMGGQAGDLAASMPGGNGQQPTPEQIRSMADKKVAPLLDQLKKNPNDTDTLTKVASFYMAAGQFDDAAKYYEKVTVIKPSADAWVRFSNAQAYDGKGDQAIASLKKALELDPKSANALYNMGMLKWKVQGDTKGALVCWEKLVQTNPNHPKLDQVKQLIAHVKQQTSASANGVAQ